jgi:catalase-peroxidase
MANQTKYGNKVSWADLMVLVGTAHLNLLVLKLLVSQVVDVWEPQEDIYWGPEKRMVVIKHRPHSRYSGDRELKIHWLQFKWD